jgi:hypothetical protein
MGSRDRTRGKAQSHTETNGPEGHSADVMARLHRLRGFWFRNYFRNDTLTGMVKLAPCHPL